MDVYYEKHAHECQELNRVIGEREIRMQEEEFKESAC